MEYFEKSWNIHDLEYVAAVFLGLESYTVN